MSQSNGELRVLVAAGEQTFGSAVTDAIEATDEAAVAERVETATSVLARTERGDIDGVLVDEKLAEPMSVVDSLTSDRGLPVVVLTDPRGDGETVSRAIEAGATDIFPRTATDAQYELVVDRIASERDGSPSVTDPTSGGQLYHEIFENASDGMVVHDPDTGEILEVNEQYCEMTGFSRAELVGETVGLVTADAPEYSVERARERIKQAREEGDTLFEWRNKHRDGSVVPVEVHLTLVELGESERVLASVRDITERKRREREYEQIFDGVNDAIAVFDPDDATFVDVNDSYREMFGYEDLETIRQQGIGGLSATEEGYTGEYASQLISEVGETGEDRTVEWRGETREGDRFWIESTLAPAEIGGEQRVLSIQRDITERRELERTYQDIFESVSDGLVVHDPETGDILEVNDQYCELTGYDREELLDETLRLLIPDDPEWTYEDAVEQIRRAREEGPSLFEFEGQRKSGETFLGEVHISTIEIRGNERVLASVRDITERKRREREFQQIFDGVEDAIVVWDPDTMRVLDANEAYLELLGYEDLATVRELGVGGLSATDDGYTEQRGREIHQRVQETGDPEMVEWKGETRDGEQLWLEVKVTPAVIGGQQRTVSIQRDITERKRRERMVRSLYDATDRFQRAETIEETCRTTVEVARDALGLPLAGFWLHRETDDGPVLEPVAGTEAAQTLDPLQFRPGDEVYETFREGEVRVHDPSERFPDNPLDASVMLPVGEHGLLAAGRVGAESYDDFVLDAARTLAGHARTALDRVEREQAVRRSERRFRLIAERIDEVIYLGKPDFSEVLYVNPAYEEIFGESVETLHDDPTAFTSVIDERDRESFLADFEQMLSEIESGAPEGRYEFEFRVRQPGGEVRWVHATGYIVELSGKNPRFVGIVDDITERKRREQRLEVFNRILRHNLRNQLDVIRSHAEVLADERTDDHADRIIAAVDELAGMGTRARKSDRIMSMDETPTELDLSAVLCAAAERVAPERSDVTLATAVPESAPLTTSEDAVTIAVENAIENAFEHAESAVTLTLEDHPEGYRILIDDDGPGIPGEELVPIEAGTETNLRHGRGLGLWQLRWSVDKLNGELSFDTTDGTTVDITIPDQAEPGRDE